jgi:hypothetical protein
VTGSGASNIDHRRQLSGQLRVEHQLFAGILGLLGGPLPSRRLEVGEHKPVVVLRDQIDPAVEIRHALNQRPSNLLLDTQHPALHARRGAVQESREHLPGERVQAAPSLRAAELDLVGLVRQPSTPVREHELVDVGLRFASQLRAVEVLDRRVDPGAEDKRRRDRLFWQTGDVPGQHRRGR